MAATTTHLMTVEEFSHLPEDDGPVYHELHHGEVVTLTRPILKHQIIRARLHKALLAIVPDGSFVASKLAFRPIPEYELRVSGGGPRIPRTIFAAHPIW